MRLRVEELALEAEVSVDTIRYYRRQGLLPAPERDGRLAWYGAEHAERIHRIRDLQRRGFTLAVIRRFLAGELDPADEELAAAVVGMGDAVGGDAVGGDAIAGADSERFDLAELAARTQVPEAVLDSLVREHLLVPRRMGGEEYFTAADVDLLRQGLELVAAGLPLPELIALARDHHAATEATAGRAVELFDTYVRHPLRDLDLTPEDRADRLVGAFETLLPAVTALVSHHFRRTLLETAQAHLEDVGTPAEKAGMAAADMHAVRTRSA